jgi:two-component system LytT family response regulator
MQNQNIPTGRLRALIVDDEPLARELLRSMLAEHRDIEIIGECGDGESAIATINRDAPDLLFLDIQMPEYDGFEVLQAIPPDRMPVIIFVTAYDRYALKAFEVEAIDYLLKPFDEERLSRALARVRTRLSGGSDPKIVQQMVAILQQLHARPAYIERLPIKSHDRVFFQSVQEIDWLEADGKYIKVHVGKEIHTIREGMTRLQMELDPARFLRISRSAIVNIDRIKELRPWFQGDYMVVLKDGKQLPSTRSYREQLQAMTGRK